MNFTRKQREKELGIAPVPNYAPDISMSAFDYFPPSELRNRKERAIRKMNSIVENTEMDRFNETYFDQYISTEEELLIGNYNEQRQRHQITNQLIEQKHKSERLRLENMIQQIEREIEKISKEIEGLERLYAEHNG